MNWFVSWFHQILATRHLCTELQTAVSSVTDVDSFTSIFMSKWRKQVQRGEAVVKASLTVGSFVSSLFLNFLLYCCTFRFVDLKDVHKLPMEWLCHSMRPSFSIIERRRILRYEEENSSSLPSSSSSPSVIKLCGLFQLQGQSFFRALCPSLLQSPSDNAQWLISTLPYHCHVLHIEVYIVTNFVFYWKEFKFIS